MSLPNPDSVVTEERLSEFYAGIRPYLGGMPDILANKFNKSDLYSTDEQLIGRWIDGKPLYQKTIDCGVLPNNAIKKVNSGISNIDTVVYLKGTSIYNNSEYYHWPEGYGNDRLYYAKSDNTIRVATNADYSHSSLIVTLKYTKTTDAAIYVGSDTDYSTDEKIVGTWIDGKPIYQKSFTGTITSGSTQNIQIGASVNHIIGVDGYAQGSSFITPVNCIVDSSTEYFTVWGRDNTNPNPNMPNTIGYRAGSALSGRDYVITLRYTKTTD